MRFILALVTFALSIPALGTPVENPVKSEDKDNISPLEKLDRAVVIYQLPIRTYLARGTGPSRTGKAKELTSERLREIKNLGVDYIWLTGVLEHSSLAQSDPDVVKGEAGSYYAIYDNWDVSPQIGTMVDFEALIKRAHAEGIRVLIDFVANHTARHHRTDIVGKTELDFGIQDRTDRFFDQKNNYFYIFDAAFKPPTQSGVGGADGVFDRDIFKDGIQLETPARVTGNDIIAANPENSDWFETVKLNYGYNFRSQRAEYNPRPKTWDQMADIATYWIKKGVDGFRADFAHAVPLEFWQFFSEKVREVNPNAFLLAEAYESDSRMKIPGFTYEKLLEAGFDSVYNSKLYWALKGQVNDPGTMRSANPAGSPMLRPAMVAKGRMLTQYMENHDELRVASRHYARWIGDRNTRAEIGLAYTAYLAMMPGHFLVHGGQELQEDANVFGPYAGDNGRTSIFDFVYQSQTRNYLYGSRPNWQKSFRNKYKKLLSLKQKKPFSLPHSQQAPTFFDLDSANWYKDQSKYIAAYIRHGKGGSYLIVANSDPSSGHVATVHLSASESDSIGVLSILGIKNNDTRYKFTEVFARPGWSPVDPAVSGTGVPGWVLHRSGSVPSGLHLGEVPAGTTYIFEIEKI